MVKMSLEIIVFIFSIIIAFTLVMRRINIAVAFGLALVIYLLPFLGRGIAVTILESFNRTLLDTILSLILAMFLADLYRSTYIADRVVSSLESLSPKTAAVSIPAIIGLLPMPAGAYISATIINPLYRECNLNPSEKTFLNYWFRHIWVTIWPLYQSVILASAILNMNFNRIIYYNWPIFIGSIISGLIISRAILYKINNSCIKQRDRSFKELIYLWPFIIIVFLSIVAKLPLPVSLMITVSLFIAIHRPSLNTVKNGIRYSLEPTIIILIVESLIFSRVINETGLSYQLALYLSSVADIAVFAIPFSMVITTGFEFTFVTIAFPSILPLLTSYRITLAFLGGYIGAMLSPIHACFVLSAKFFKSSLGEVYRYLIPTAILTVLIVVALLPMLHY